MPANAKRARKNLLSLRDEIQGLSKISSESRGAVKLDQQSVGRLSRMDAMQAQAMAQATERQRRLSIARIEAALGRIDEGEYGACLECGEEIADNRLDIDPAATHCIGCASGK